MLCTVFLAEETNVRKTVIAMVSQTLRKCNGHWRTRVYERKRKMSGFLLRVENPLDSVASGPGLLVQLPSNITVAPLSGRLWSPRTEQIGEEISAKPIRPTAGLGQGQKPSPLIWKKATPPPLPLVPRSPNKNPNFTPETLHAINCYRAIRVEFITVGNGAVIMSDSRWIKDNDRNLFGTLRLPLP
jgi:hypothetical protein